MADMTFEEALSSVMSSGTPVIHRSWPQQGWRCYIYRTDGALVFHHTNGQEEPLTDKYKNIVAGTDGWTDELVD